MKGSHKKKEKEGRKRSDRLLLWGRERRRTYFLKEHRVSIQKDVLETLVMVTQHSEIISQNCIHLEAAKTATFPLHNSLLQFNKKTLGLVAQD